jgi:phosphoribosyl-AMP cyclohydrolase
VTDLSAATKAFIEGLTFDTDGLIPAIAQQHDSGEVLMMAWMNRQSITETLAGGRVVYWSRSRQALWRKGDSSGQEQRLIELRVDCDRDCLLLLVDQIGVACHTGRRNCFFTAIRDNNPIVVADVIIDPSQLYKG